MMTSGSLGGVIVSVVVCTDLSGKELHRQVGVGMVMISRSLAGVMVNVVVCTDLSGKEAYRQVGVGRVVISGSLGTVILASGYRNISMIALCW